MKSNFTQALKELTGFDEPATPQNESANNSTAATGKPQDYINVKIDSSAGSKKFYTESAADFSDTECTQITGSMIIKGNIVSHDNIHMDGQIYGNVITSGNFTASNIIIGDLKAQNALLNSARIKGNVFLEGHFDVNENSVISGDISCDSINVSGKIKGNLNIKDSAVFRENSLIVGDIVSGSIAAEPGALIDGNIKTLTDSFIDINSEFDFGGDF